MLQEFLEISFQKKIIKNKFISKAKFELPASKYLKAHLHMKKKMKQIHYSYIAYRYVPKCEMLFFEVLLDQL